MGRGRRTHTWASPAAPGTAPRKKSEGGELTHHLSHQAAPDNTPANRERRASERMELRAVNTDGEASRHVKPQVEDRAAIQDDLGDKPHVH